MENLCGLSLDDENVSGADNASPYPINNGAYKKPMMFGSIKPGNGKRFEIKLEGYNSYEEYNWADPRTIRPKYYDEIFSDVTSYKITNRAIYIQTVKGFEVIRGEWYEGENVFVSGI